MLARIQNLYEKHFPDNATISRFEVPKFPTAEGNLHEHFIPDTFFSVVKRNLIIRVLAKKTPYTQFPLECMVYTHRLDGGIISQISDFSNQELTYFGKFLNKLLSLMASITGRVISLSVNQQKRCIEIPHKFDSDGVEVKVQTINNFHVHVFSFGDKGGIVTPFSDLTLWDKQDFYDPYSPFVLGNEFTQIPNSALFFNPRIGGGELTQQVLDLNEFYCRQYDIFINRIQTNPNSDLEENLAKLISREITVDPKLYPVLGPAFTCVLMGNNKLLVSPRIVSRGNAMEASFVWVDQSDPILENEITRRVKMFQILALELGKEFSVLAGELLQIYG